MAYNYPPTTPPTAYTAGQYLNTIHSRSTSGSSIYTLDSSPESVNTCITTPNRSPAYPPHGRALLPKIRPQDVVVEPVSQKASQRHRRAMSSTVNPAGYAPYPSARLAAPRPAVDSTGMLIPPISTASALNAHLASPVSTPTEPRGRSGHSRNVSAPSIDESTLSRYGYPTYRQLPKFVSQYSPTTPVSSTALTLPNYGPAKHDPLPHQSYSGTPGVYNVPTVPTKRLEAPVSIAGPAKPQVPTSTTLFEYLTAPTQAVNLTQNISGHTSSQTQTHFWWDIRNLRRWSTFSLDTMSEIPKLSKLLTTDIPDSLTPKSNISSSRLLPDSEFALATAIRDIYAPRVNAALRVSQGRECLSLYAAPEVGTNHENGPHFLANYPSDTEITSTGSPRGRLVGLVKTFDRWNTGMRNEQPHRRVEYLHGLSHLQRCMREHSCRYGFIMNEIELVCVRAGCDEGGDVPYFGFLELATPITTNTSSASYNALAACDLERTYSSDSSQSSDYSGSSRSTTPERSSTPGLSGPFTATLALYYLLMLSKAVPLPGQPSWHLNVGGPGALPRQRVLPEGKDKWIPDPQLRERRYAKRVRGWVMPQDAWHRRESAGRKPTKPKQWHK
ncbi:hypothetical protein LOZ45_000647 [Ophidiomyces ophidiicola]|nr:hypothetical protein LOZ45_000647 [Ophidiomyces ophidiicola]